MLVVADGIAIASFALGCARERLDHSDCAMSRYAFGGPISRFQGLVFQLADLAVAVENARKLTYRAAWLKDQGRPIGGVAASQISRAPPSRTRRKTWQIQPGAPSLEPLRDPPRSRRSPRRQAVNQRAPGVRDPSAGHQAPVVF